MRRGDGVACARRLCAVKMPCPLPLILMDPLKTCTQYVPGRSGAATVPRPRHRCQPGPWTYVTGEIRFRHRKTPEFAEVMVPSYATAGARLQPLLRLCVRVFRGRRRDRQRDDAALAPPRAVQADAREAPHLRVGRGAGGPGVGPLPDALLCLRAPVRRVRRRSDLPLPVGRALPRARLVRPRRDGGVHRDPRRRAVLRVEEEGSQLVLSAHRPTIDLDAAKAALERSIAGRAKVSVLDDTLVVDVDRANLVEVARIVRDDPATRCDLYSVNAGVDTGAELRSVTFVRGTETKVFVMLRTSCTELDPHVPSLAAVCEGANC